MIYSKLETVLRDIIAKFIYWHDWNKFSRMSFLEYDAVVVNVPDEPLTAYIVKPSITENILATKYRIYPHKHLVPFPDTDAAKQWCIDTIINLIGRDKLWSDFAKATVPKLTVRLRDELRPVFDESIQIPDFDIDCVYNASSRETFIFTIYRAYRIGSEQLKSVHTEVNFVDRLTTSTFFVTDAGQFYVPHIYKVIKEIGYVPTDVAYYTVDGDFIFMCSLNTLQDAAVVEKTPNGDIILAYDVEEDNDDSNKKTE